MKIGVLGPHGTYAELAARAHFKDKGEFVPYPMIMDIAEAVARSEVDAGVIPVESLREGTVGEALDSLAWVDVHVQAEIVSPISHSLLGVKGARLEKITQVLSHPQALAQCKDFLRKNLPKAELIEMTSTAKAAEQAGKMKQPHMAAIGPKGLAKIYGLDILRDDIQAGETNLTRFLCLAREDCKRTGHDKTSIVFYTAADKPGVLYEILGEFASRRINLTKIESRPSKKALGDYLFFIDLEGHREDGKVKDALKRIGEKTAMLKILGSYSKKF